MRDHVERLLGIEPLRAERDHGGAVREGRHEHVVEPADPRPVGGSPDPVARLREEVVRELEAGKVPGEDAVAVQRPFRRAGRAGRVDEQGGRVGRRRRGLEVGRRRREKRVEISVDVDRDAVPAELRRPLERAALCEKRSWLRATKSDLESVGAERGAQRHRDRAELVCGHVGERRLGSLGEHDRDSVAGLDAEAGERIGKPVRAFAQLAEAHRAGDLTPVRDEDRRRVRGLPVRHLDPEVEPLRQHPAVRGAELVVAGRGHAHSRSSIRR